MLTTRKGRRPRESRQTLTLSAERFFANRWFGSFLGQFSRNEDLGLVYRAVTGGGVGRVLIDRPTRRSQRPAGFCSSHA
jgi:hypothetical protein